MEWLLCFRKRAPRRTCLTLITHGSCHRCHLPRAIRCHRLLLHLQLKQRWSLPQDVRTVAILWLDVAQAFRSPPTMNGGRYEAFPVQVQIELYIGQASHNLLAVHPGSRRPGVTFCQ
ncbi:uncharacterized protein K489DRAFT_64609 [Dissoconium aciculare CBS 342.82]|uniref:Uncharacterized protein n=1 Tax=Dissoconium aciculare CBS 342.82 TaxID=1314786 RepID=A0A6J3LU94_9PEZI|nr:uncharacterized protein K489DRAFT_64609 [Dissoconium aciculare CBS 342.82]KAF1819355.1 hypothetical protein K489DRAFT_64609 [Dissoconium aciculare CBS 342.82]